MTAEEISVEGYYVAAGFARNECKQGVKFLTLLGGYGVSEATWEPMSTFMQPDGTINPVSWSYLMENNECQLLTRAEAMSQHNQLWGCYSLPLEPAPAPLRYGRLLTEQVTTLSALCDPETAFHQCLVYHMTDTVVASHGGMLTYQQSVVMQGVSTFLCDKHAHS